MARSKDFISSIQDSAQNRRDLPAIDWRVHQLAFAFPPTWDTEDGIGGDARRAVTLAEAERR